MANFALPETDLQTVAEKLTRINLLPENYNYPELFASNEIPLELQVVLANRDEWVRKHSLEKIPNYLS